MWLRLGLGFSKSFLLVSNYAVLIVTALVGWIICRVVGAYFNPLKKIPWVPDIHPVLKPFLILFNMFKKKDYHFDRKFRNWCEQFQETGAFRFSPFGILDWTDRICFFKPEYVKQIMVSNSYSYSKVDGGIKSLITPLGNGLLTSDGKEHAWQRKVIHPAFSYGNIKQFVPVFDKNVDNLIEVWKKKINENHDKVADILIGGYLNHLALDVIGQTAFGYNFNTLTTGENEVSEAFNNILRGNFGIGLILVRRFIPFYKYLPFESNVKANKAQELTDKIVWKIIKNRRETMSDKEDEEKPDLLTILMKAKDSDSERIMSDELLHNEIYTFMLAGYETTSTALTWILYLLAIHPQYQEEARAEVKNLLRGSCYVTSEIVDKLEYITAVIKEAIRMYPPAIMTTRQAIKDEKIGDYDVPKGTVVTIPICAIHYMEEYWKEPEKYNPQRFMKKGDGKISPSTYTFLPFSVGPRNCIGNRFALTEMQVAVAKILYTFKLSIAADHPEVHTTVRLMLKPEPAPILQMSLLA